MFNFINDCCKKCRRCLISKTPQPNFRPAMRHLIAKEPAHGKENALVMTDISTKCTRVIPIKIKKSRNCCRRLIYCVVLRLRGTAALSLRSRSDIESDIIR